jgi:predicted adenylyl cyclase CyaB
MAIEIEKKYRLSEELREQLSLRLREVGAEREGLEFEENTIYTGGNLVTGRSILRVRRVEGRAILTYKERYPSTSGIKRQHEEETGVDNPEALTAILDALGLVPALVYEKRRETWRVAGAIVVIDELPFGLYMEIEWTAENITKTEKLLGIEDLKAETRGYPRLTAKYGKVKGDIAEARFGSRRLGRDASQPAIFGNGRNALHRSRKSLVISDIMIARTDQHEGVGWQEVGS